MPGRHEHYFDTDPSTPSRRHQIELTLPDLHLTLDVDRGVFSGDRVDPGTKLLLSDGPPLPPAATTLLDLGCGYGPIALALAKRAPQATVWAVDVNERALALAADNTRRLGLDNVRVGRPDSVASSTMFDAIWSNPPIRIGKAALHDLLLHWLPRLTPQGEAVLVVQKHLGADSLQRWLDEQGWPTERFVARAGYRLLRVRRS